MRLLTTCAQDLLAKAVNKHPVLLTVAGAPGQKALMTAPDALPGYLALVPEGTTFVNGVAARVAPAITWHRPGKKVKDVAIPILFCICDHDSVAPPEETIAYAKTAPRGEIKTYDAGHFDIYLGAPFESVIADQIEFLTRHLKA